ncbi:MAG: hypothetical protein R6U00_03235 [Prochlorococcaceae cyanobacterium]
MAEAAARLRRGPPASGGLSTMAALELACAISAGAALMLSNDGQLLQRRPPLDSIALPILSALA